MDWTTFLSSRGAVMAPLMVASFGDPSSELAAARDAAVLCDLTAYGVLRVEGNDAEAFLQGQLTRDMQELAIGATAYAGWCSPKGRLLATLLVHRISRQRFDLVLPAVLTESIRKRLSMYVLRAKVRVTDDSAASVRLGVGGPKAEPHMVAWFRASPAQDRALIVEGGTLIGLPGSRFMIIAQMPHAIALWERIAHDARPAGFPVWEWLTVRAGVPVITPPTQDQFVPQAANWDALGGISFQKGCYTGQEIVARTHYLGRLKERLFIAHADIGSASPGERLYSAAFADQPCGTIVNAAPAPGGGIDMLAVVQVAAAESGDLHIGHHEGPSLAMLPLPYTVPAPTAPRRGFAP